MKEQAKTGLGRGVLYNTVAVGAFFGVGAIIRVTLGRYLGPVDYGVFAVVIGLMNMVNISLTSGLPRSVSKYISEEDARAGSIIRQVNKILLGLCIVLFALYFALAGVIADILNDSSLTPYIRLSALCLPAYAFFQVYGAGYLNGMRYLAKQAMASIAHSLIKVIVVLVLVLLGFGVEGAIIGYLVAVIGAFLLAWKFLGPVESIETGFEQRRLIAFAVPVTLYAVFAMLLGQIGLFSIKVVVADGDQVGFYAAAIDISRLATLFVGGLGIALFPSISSSTAMNDHERTASYIRQSIRYSLILLLPMLLVISATSTELATLIFSTEYAEAGSPLAILAFAVGCISMFAILDTIIMGSGKPGIVLGMVVPMVGVEIVLNMLLVPDYGMEGAAWAHLITSVFGMCAAAAYVFWRFRVLFSVKSVARICLASAVIYVIALQVSVPSLWLPFVYIGLFALYGGLLLATRELGKDDWKTFRRIVPLERLIGREDIIS